MTQRTKNTTVNNIIINFFPTNGNDNPVKNSGQQFYNDCLNLPYGSKSEIQLYALSLEKNIAAMKKADSNFASHKSMIEKTIFDIDLEEEAGISKGRNEFIKKSSLGQWMNESRQSGESRSKKQEQNTNQGHFTSLLKPDDVDELFKDVKRRELF